MLYFGLHQFNILFKTSTDKMLEIGQEITLTIESIGINGEGVGYWEGFTLFVEGALPGETVVVCLYERQKRYGRAEVLKYFNQSPDRVEPICPLFGRCGGCQLMHLTYAQHLIIKTQRVKDALQRIGKLFDLDVLPCEPSPSQTNYRNKIQLPVLQENDGLKIGLYAKNSHDLVEVDHCHIHCDLGEKAYQHIQKILKSSGLMDIRHLLIKTAFYTGQVLVILVTNGKISLNKVARQIMDGMPEIKGVVQNINSATTNVILSNQYHLVAGESMIEEKLCGLFFKVSPASFFQVNPAQAQKLYEKVLEFAELTGCESVLDAYCGVGTISLILAKHAKKVIGIECVPEAIADAQENAKRNGITNVRFICAQAELFIPNLKQNIDVAVINPPRKGCELSFLEGLVLLAPKRILYISCDPATLARDLAFLVSKNYCISHVQPFDMFPQTSHVETLVSLSSITY
jgi:23S rRNA (uracil1939-C5)-methyltransferase